MLLLIRRLSDTACVAVLSWEGDKINVVRIRSPFIAS